MVDSSLPYIFTTIMTFSSVNRYDDKIPSRNGRESSVLTMTMMVRGGQCNYLLAQAVANSPLFTIHGEDGIVHWWRQLVISRYGSICALCIPV